MIDTIICGDCKFHTWGHSSAPKSNCEKNKVMNIDITECSDYKKKN